MLGKNDECPSLIEAVDETRKREELLEELIPEIKKFSIALILAGSLAFAKNYKVRETSDIDLVILIEKDNLNNIRESNLFDDNTLDTKLKSFDSNVVQTFSIIQVISDIKVEFHFWNKETYYDSIRLKTQLVKRFSSISNSTSTVHYDFCGNLHQIPNGRKSIPFEKGFLQEYPVFEIINNKFVPYEPLNNLIMLGEVIFTQDGQIFDMIDVMWEKLIEKFIEENKTRPIDLFEANVLKSQPGNWNLSAESRGKIMQKFKKGLQKLDIKYIE